MSRETDRKALKPTLSSNRLQLEGEVREIVRSVWSFDVDSSSIKALDSYDDFNVYVRPEGATSVLDKSIFGDQSEEFLLKLYNGVDSTMNLEILEGLGALMNHIKSHSNINVPVPIRIKGNCSVGGEGGVAEEEKDFKVLELPRINGSVGGVACRLFSWVPGKTLNGAAASIGPSLLYNLGHTLGRMTKALVSFNHSAFHREHDWDLLKMKNSVKFFEYVEDEEVKRCIHEVSSKNEALLAGVAEEEFNWSIIMGDANDANIIVQEAGGEGGGRVSISGIIDFGDAVYTWTVCELAIALAYALLSPYSRDHPWRVIGCILKGYRKSFPFLSEKEVSALKTLIATRLSLSISVGAFSIYTNPANREYLELHSKPAKIALLWLWSQDDSRFHEFCRLTYADSAPGVIFDDDNSFGFIDDLVPK